MPDRAHEPAEEPHQALGDQHSSHDMDALTEPHSSAEEDARMQELAEAPPQRASTTTQHSAASAGFAADFGDTATSSGGMAPGVALAP